MYWREQWIAGVLEKVPAGSYRKRMESELRDHLETQYRALMESGRTEAEARAETLRMMGEPEKLQGEYRAAWRRTPLELLTEWVYRLISWAVGGAAMIAAQLLVTWVMEIVLQQLAALLPRNSHPWIRLIRDTAWNLNYSPFFWYLLPFVFALIAGAYFLSRLFQTSYRPAWQISIGLFFHWALVHAFFIVWEAADGRRTFWEQLKLYWEYGVFVRYFSFITLARCVLQGVVFWHMSAKRNRPAAA